MAFIDDLKVYLGPAAAQYTDPVLASVIASEASAQATRVQSQYLMFEDVLEALKRRCQRALALRALPLGLTDASGDSGDRAYVPGQDAEIRRMEAPYRRIVVG